MTTPSQGDPSQSPAPTGAVELPFQAEVQQVLALVINSLYTHKEVFLRELVSNASDALDKARFLSLTRKDVLEPAGEARISLRLDDDKRTLTVEDNGVGMTRDEVVQNLGTIARSGSLDFVKAYAEAAKSKEAGLKIIGQFGVGFYAAFMVAARVDVHTLSMLPGGEPVIWRSTGSGSFTVLPGERETPGTEIVLHLKEEEREYLRPARVREIIKKYSDFVQFPIYVDDELVNRSSAIWALPKSQVTDDQHTEFFRRITGSDTQSPLLRVHTSVDAPVQYHALLYVPEKAPLDLFSKERRGLRLYAKRVLIVEDCDKLVPQYLRFLRGVVDSEDVPLNVSREMLQEDRNLLQIQQQLTKSVLRALADLATGEPEKYAIFWAEFGRLVKEGVAMDWKHKDELAELCRFESHLTPPDKLISLKQYVAAMPADQKEIYYITGPNRRAVEEGPHLEALKKRGYDVLFFIDPVDEWVAQALSEFDKRRLKSAVHGDVDLGDTNDEKAVEDAAGVIPLVKAALGAKVKDVRFSRRLTDSASCLVAEEGDPSANMQRILKMLDAKTEESPRILELNPSHPIIKNLSALGASDPKSERIPQWSELLFDQALLAEGIVKDPTDLVKRIQSLFTEVTTAAVAKKD
ncbi:MAG TPA: molecular chaperone HtpG [Polyangiaceae bacterium]|nr:molecular chaperone HtpG [Polyangiaceae bacterium]